MAQALNFEMLWQKYHASRKIGAAVTDGNRCALVLGAALGLKYKPRLDQGEISFRGVGQVKSEMKEMSVLDNYYLRAEQLALRLKEEWGEPDIKVYGPDALKSIADKKGIIFVENAWRTRAFAKTVDHIDIWNGKYMASSTVADSEKAFQNADMVWLWIIH